MTGSCHCSGNPRPGRHVVDERSCAPRSPCRPCRSGCRAASSPGSTAPQRQDEADARRPDRRAHRDPARRAERRPSPCLSADHPLRSFFLYMASIRSVTAKPPKMLMLASTTAASPSHLAPGTRRRRGDQRADDDHRGDGVGHRHQRRVQRRRHRPDHIIADEAGQHEDRQDRDEVHPALLRLEARAPWRRSQPLSRPYRADRAIPRAFTRLS